MSSVSEDRSLRGATALHEIAPGRFSANLSARFTVLGHPNGGYLQCVMANAALAVAKSEGSTHQHVTAITSNFIRATNLGAVEATAVMRRSGRGASFVTVSLFQDGQMTTESVLTLGNLSRDTRPRYHDAQVPTLAAFEDCVRADGGDDVSILNVIDLRLDPSCVGWRTGKLSERAEIKGWTRLSDGDAEWDAWSLLFAGDALPPATFPVGSSGWVPTLQLSTYVRHLPRSEWLTLRQWAVVINDGLVDERCELFDDAGELVASTSQLAMVRFPDEV